MEIENWSRIHPLHFVHHEYGKLQLNGNGVWEQTSPQGQFRLLQATTLRLALDEVKKNFKKPKPEVSKTKKVVKPRAKKEPLAEIVEKPKKLVKKIKLGKKKTKK